MSAAAPALSARKRADLVGQIEHVRGIERELLRRLILEQDRIDLLATEVLGYQVEPHHLRMMAHQYKHPDGNLCLGFRGSGKSLIRTVARSVWRILKDPDVRILIASKSAANAGKMLGEVKAHFAAPRFREVFGDWIGSRWEEAAIEVSRRTKAQKEPTINTVGIESSVVSLHYDAILADDLVDEENARTPYMRTKLHTWYYKQLIPCLEPGGELSVTGTHYHYSDLHMHLRKHDMSGDRTLLVPALLGDAETGYRSAWPSKFAVAYLLRLRATMGSILFDSQYQVDVARMKGGGIFDVDHIVEIDDDQIPEGLPRFAGVDLAVALHDKADRFYLVVIAYDRPTDTVYVLDRERGRFKVKRQRELVAEVAARHEGLVRMLAESNQYQAAFSQELAEDSPGVPIRPSQTKLDKLTRAWKLSGKFESGKVLFRRGLSDLIDEIVLFPGGDHDDGFDALDLAVRAATYRQRRPPREVEPGIL